MSDLHRLTKPDRPAYRVEPNGCWLWLGSLKETGYGQRYWKGKISCRAHRVFYEEMVGPVPPGLDLDHLCRNRACVNPAHLDPVTRKENLRRGAGPSLHRIARMGADYARTAKQREDAVAEVVGGAGLRATARKYGMAHQILHSYLRVRGHR